jgi:hypothetical protein
MNRHLVEREENSAPESISDTEDWLDWNGDLDHPNNSKHDSVAGVESSIEQDNSIKDPECPDQPNVSATANVPRLI